MYQLCAEVRKISAKPNGAVAKPKKNISEPMNDAQYSDGLIIQKQSQWSFHCYDHKEAKQASQSQSQILF